MRLFSMVCGFLWIFNKSVQLLNPNEIDVHVSCEVGGKEHGDRVLDQLIQNGYHVKVD